MRHPDSTGVLPITDNSLPDSLRPDDLSARAEIVCGKLIAAIDRGYARMLASHPIEDYIAALDEAPAYSRYRTVSPSAANICDSIRKQWGYGGLEHYHRLSVAYLAAKFSGRVAFQAMPVRVRQCCIQALQRILGIAENGRPGYFDHANDLFAKDLAVCRGKLIPCGAELVDWQAGLPRRVLLGHGLPQFIHGARYISLKLHGFKPLYESHWDRRLITDFNADGYRRFYLNVAELLRTSPEVKGYMACGWWFDPALSAISPDLDFIGKIPLENGAILLATSTEESAVQDAIRMSRQRTELYKAGKYQPVNYVMLWSRADLLAWHQTAG